MKIQRQVCRAHFMGHVDLAGRTCEENKFTLVEMQVEMQVKRQVER